MMKFAAKLGADCAFFIKNSPSLAAGVGEKLSNIDVSLAGKFMLLIYPDIHISTRVAFADMIPQVPSKKIADILSQQRLSQWKHDLVNDFENSLFNKFPVLKNIKTTLYNAGAQYASMSGSGSCMYGIFEKETEVEIPQNYIYWAGIL